MKRKIKYYNLLLEMVKHKENQTDLGKLLGVSQATISHRLCGMKQWTIGEIETICNHYGKDYYELFKKED